MFGFMRAMPYKEAYNRRLRELTVLNGPASHTGKSECCNSGLCCWRAPGELTPIDVAKLARHFNISEQEFFKTYCAVDRVDGHLTLRLIRKGWTPGEMIGWMQSYDIDTPCVFLDVDNGNKCKVHDSKPEVCASFKCWDAAAHNIPMPLWNEDALTGLGWDGIDPDD